MPAFIVSRRLLFLGFVLLGMASGFFVGSLRSAFAAEVRQPADKQATALQQNSLVVLVDDLANPQPVLLGAWLAVRNGSQATWMPLYPQPISSGSGYAQPGEPIRLASAELSSLSALAPVTAAGVHFDEVYMLDQVAAASISSLTAAPFEPVATWQQPQAALQAQVQLIQALCAQAWGAPAQLDAALSLMPDHLHSSVTAFELITRWDAWATDGYALSCQHPWAEQ